MAQGGAPGTRALKLLGVLSVATFLIELAGNLTVSKPQQHPASSSSSTSAALVPEHTSAPRVITTVVDSNNKSLDILDETIPEDCYAEAHADYAGYAVQWGLGNKARSAAECCRMCKEYKAKGEQGVPHGCNIWVWCGDPSGVCWTMDIHHHTTGDCWLKYQASWDGIVDKQVSNLEINHRGKFTPEFRTEHKTAPEVIPWVAGLVSIKKGT